MTPGSTSEPSGEYRLDHCRARAWLGQSATAISKGFSSGLAFLIGAAISYASFRGWRYVVAGAIGPGGQTRFAWLFVAPQLVAVLAGAWVIIKFLGLNLAAAALGLLVSGAAVVLEIIYELIYAS